jgi:hypothetical protein
MCAIVDLSGMDGSDLELKAAKLDTANLSPEAARLLALELFREEKISLGRPPGCAAHRSLPSWNLWPRTKFPRSVTA